MTSRVDILSNKDFPEVFSKVRISTAACCLGLSLSLSLLTKMTPRGWRESNWNSVDKLHFCLLMGTFSPSLHSSPCDNLHDKACWMIGCVWQSHSSSLIWQSSPACDQDPVLAGDSTTHFWCHLKIYVTFLTWQTKDTHTLIIIYWISVIDVPNNQISDVQPATLGW